MCPVSTCANPQFHGTIFGNSFESKFGQHAFDFRCCPFRFGIHPRSGETLRVVGWPFPRTQKATAEVVCIIHLVFNFM